MIKSVRFSEDLSTRIHRAAKGLGVSESEFIREAISKECDQVLGDSLAERLAPIIGCVQSSGGRARNTGKAFRKALRDKVKARSR